MPSLAVSGFALHSPQDGPWPLLGILAQPDAYPTVTEVGIQMLSGSDRTMVIGFSVESSLGTYDVLSPNYILGENAGDAVDTDQNGITLIKRWVSKPSVPASYFRRGTIGSNATILATPQYIFPFYRGLKLNPSTALIVWRITNVAGSSFGAEPGEILFNVWLDG